MFEFLKIYSLPVLFWGALFFVIRNYFKTEIDTSFEKKMENHKHDLQIASEEARFDFQRKIKARKILPALREDFRML
jgi:hypothetical protein